MIFIFALHLMIRPIYPIIDYALNYAYISTELCENTNKPELECNGKCHLVKELAKEAQDEAPASDSKKVNVNEMSLLFYADITPFVFEKHFVEEEKQTVTSYSNLYQKEDTFVIFHPPAQLS
jgi:hypothetical protein